MKSALVLCALLVASAAYSQDYETVLLPIATVPATGAFGSRWVTTFHVYNGNDVPLDPAAGDILPLDGPCGTQPPCRTHPPLLPHEISRPEIYWRHGEGPGVLLHVRRHLIGRLTFQLRVQDISRQSLTWGTEIPVVRASEVLTGEVNLVQIPMDLRFRQTLRVYDIDSRISSQVRLRIYSPESNAPLVETTLQLSRPVSGTCPDPESCYPGYAEITHLRDRFPELVFHDTVRAEIEPLTEGLRYWAFVSVTNNETQHVTTITPQ